MKKLLFLFLLSSLVSFSQKKNFNLKKGYAVKGFDVVSYFSNNAKEGDKKYTTTKNGIKYKFVSQENLEAFNKNPKKYIPQYGGYCAYAIGAKGKKVSINPETFEIRDGKLYLFYNRGRTNTLEMWLNEGAEKLQKKADVNWQKIIQK
jgi:YHS domain-containing protein